MKVRLRKLVLTGLLLFVCIGCLMPFSAFAKTDLYSFENFYDDEEFNEIVEVARNSSGVFSLSMILGSDGNDLSKIAYAYKRYSLKITSFLSLANADRDLDSEIEDAYRWIIVTDDGGQIEIGKENGVWTLIGFTEAPKNNFSNRVRIEMLQDAVSALKVNNLTILYAGYLRQTVFAYVQTEEGVFLVPFSVRPDFTALENGKLYTREEVAEIIQSEWGEELKAFKASLNEEDLSPVLTPPAGGGGQPQSPIGEVQPKKIPLSIGAIVLIVSGSVLFVGGGILCVLLIKRKKSL